MSKMSKMIKILTTSPSEQATIDLWGEHAAWISLHKTKDEGPSPLEVERIRSYASG